MLQKNKIPAVAFAVAWLSMLACSLTQEPECGSLRGFTHPHDIETQCISYSPAISNLSRENKCD